MSHGIRNVSLAPTAINLLPDNVSRREKTNPTVPTVSAIYLQRDAQPAPSQSQESAELVSFPSRSATGTMIALTASPVKPHL